MANQNGTKGMRIPMDAEDIELRAKAYRGKFYTLHLPAAIASAGGMYWMIANGMIQKTGGSSTTNSFLAYFPKCAGAALIAYSFTSSYLMRSTYKQLMARDGQFSRHVKEMQKEMQEGGWSQRSGLRAENPAAVIQADDPNTPNDVVNSILKPQTEDSQLPTRALTYEDLRQKNRLDGSKSRPAPARSSMSQPVVENPSKGEYNRYGDALSEDS